MKIRTLSIILLLTLLFSLTLVPAAAQEEMPMVRAILFYSPTCPHCEQVITQDLPPLFEEYGNNFLVLGIDISTEAGSEIFLQALQELEFDLESAGVPFLVIGDVVMVGSAQIPEELPVLVAEGMAGDGIPWPEVPVLQQFLLDQGFVNADGMDITPTPQPEMEPAGSVTEAVEESSDPPVDTPMPDPSATPQEDLPEPEIILMEDDQPETVFDLFAQRFNRDPVANGIAVIVLLFLIGVVVFIAIKFMQAAVLKPWPEWVLPVLLIIGISIAIYLATAEVSGDEVVCGPVGDCNAVQQSKYATLFGFLPVAILGLIGYIVIGVTWWVGRMSSGNLQFYTKLGMFLSALFGLLFFIYLTFLEPFVIGATCAWCVTSAIIMALINLFTLPVVLDAWAQLDDEDLLDEEE
jgi:uncharacterized membrane protein